MEVGDLQFETPPGDPKPAPGPDKDQRRQVVLLAAAAVAVVVLAAGLWMLLGGPEDDGGDAPVAEMATPAAEPAPPPGPVEIGEPEVVPEPVELPLLGESDTFVRDLVDALLAHPNLAAWMVGENLLRRFVVTVDNVANGRNPAQQLPALRPDRRFRTSGEGERLLIDTGSYQRYDLFASVVDALDPSAAALLYQTLEPLLDEAHAEIGYPDTPFRSTLERAVGQLLTAPVIDTPPIVVRRATQYLYADERLEALTPAQKQFLGMGPDNVQAIQAQLRAISDEIGLTVE
jgi:hypothetical protein